MTEEPIISSLLDTDLYKITMQAAIHKFYSKVPAEFKLTNRTPNKQLSNEALTWLRKQIAMLGDLRFQEDEIAYLKSKVGYLGNDYFDWLQKDFKLTPDVEVSLAVDEGNSEMTLLISGDWDIVTIYEIPILALVSEAYFKFVDLNWTINGSPATDEAIVNHAKEKSVKLLEAGCTFSEFGTRRRRSLNVQRNVMKGIMEAVELCKSSTGTCLGTSNILLAKEFNTNPIGTIGHEWMMGVAAVSFSKSHNYEAYTKANELSVRQYVELVGLPNAGLALTDTYGTENFLSQFEEPYIGAYIGMRQDSGSPEEYSRLVSKWYAKHGYTGKKAKMICFSDSLNVDKCIRLKRICEEECGMKSSFGIGTNFTNDFDTEPMNIVCKLISCGGSHAIKISDNVGKNMGDKETVLGVKKALGYVDKNWSQGDEAHRWSK